MHPCHAGCCCMPALRKLPTTIIVSEKVPADAGRGSTSSSAGGDEGGTSTSTRCGPLKRNQFSLHGSSGDGGTSFRLLDVETFSEMDLGDEGKYYRRHYAKGSFEVETPDGKKWCGKFNATYPSRSIWTLARTLVCGPHGLNDATRTVVQ